MAAPKSPYASVAGGNLVFAGVDQGIDFTGKGPVYALDKGQVTRVQSFGSGWPGQGALLSYRLDAGPYAGKNVYVSEDFQSAAGIAVGSVVPKGGLLGYGTGTGQAPGIEIGFAQPSGSPIAPLPPPRPASQFTPQGAEFLNYVEGHPSGSSLSGSTTSAGLGGSVSSALSGAEKILITGSGLDVGRALVGLAGAGGVGSGISKWLGIPSIPKNAIQRSAEMVGGAALVFLALVITGKAAVGTGPVKQTAGAVRTVAR